MSVRQSTSRTTTNHVTKKIGESLITLYYRDCFSQNKAQLYSAIKKIESGKLKANKNYSVFYLEVDGSLTGMIKK